MGSVIREIEKRCAPVGVFDSGLGGLSVMRALRNQLPNERFIYLADSARSPYGEKQPEEIVRISNQISSFLVQSGCKCVVVACNTATAAAIRILRNIFPVPFIGMEPAVKTAASSSTTGRIGVLATRGTFSGNHFLNTRERHSDSVSIIEQTGDGLVELAEQGQFSGERVESKLLQLLSPMFDQGIDQLVLGCTHYPLFMDSLKRITPPGITIINPAPAVARQTARILKEQDILCTDGNSDRNLYYSTGEIQMLETMARASGEEDGVFRSLDLPENADNLKFAGECI